MKKTPRTLRIVAAAMVMVLTILAFLNVSPPLPQAGTALLKAAATGAGITLVLVAVLLLLTLIVGRFFCAVLCPLGILQDLIGWRGRRKPAAQKNHYRLRYLILIIVAGFLLAGWALPAKMLEPFSIFGRVLGGFLLPVVRRGGQLLGMSGWSANLTPSRSGIVVGAGSLVIFIALVIWKRRIYCTAICPVGTLLGLCAKHGIFRLRLKTPDCIGCGRCAAVCPTACIDLANGKLDNERCVRCMNCVAVCPQSCVVWERVLPGQSALPHTSVTEAETRSRRLFLFEMAGALIVSCGLARLFKPGGVAGRKAPTAIYPPGAGSSERFATTCTTCLLCVTRCPGNVLRPPTRATPAVHLEYDNGMCEFNCHACAEVCPTGAILQMMLEDKRRCRIGMAVFHPSRCIAVVDGTHCGACAEHCPTGALRMVQHDGAPCPIPELEEALCIGCGNCSYPCPARPIRAMTIAAVPVQVQAADPNDYFTPLTPDQSSPADDWLL